MFGYVRPLKGELKVREYEEFKAVYCGLCHALKRNCGFRARFIVNYDFVFLAMLLSEKRVPEHEFRRCVASPFKKKCLVVQDPTLELAADYSVILTYWKLMDGVQDGGFAEALSMRFRSLLLRRAYNKAVSRNPEFDSLTRKNLGELTVLERAGCASVDMAADKFALILAAASGGAVTESRRRILYQALYHIGRAVYIMDAADDFEEDLQRNMYNVLINRFGARDSGLSEADKAEIKLTLTHSVNIIVSAFELLEPNAFHNIIENIADYGMPFVTEKILAGEWRQTARNDRRGIETA